MAETLYRTVIPALEVLTRAKGGDGRTIAGIAVPYNTPMRIDARLTEQFARGAFNAQLRAGHRVMFARDHITLGGSLIGKTTMLRDDAAGLYFEARVSATPVGDETLTLVTDGVLDQLSIGFREGSNRRAAGGVTERITASLFEIAVVMEGAYGAHASVAEVREAGSGMSYDEQAAQIIASLRPLPLPPHA